MAPLAVSPPGARAEAGTPNWVWSPQVSGTALTLYGVSAYDRNNVWAVGGYLPEPALASQDDGELSTRGVILYYDDGNRWVEQKAPTDHCLMGVSAVAPDEVWAVGLKPGYVPEGGSAVVLRFDGKEWEVFHSEDEADMRDVSALASNDVWVACVPGDHAWAIGSEGTILMGTRTQPSTYYFAEGYTGEGFQEYLAPGNPNPEEAVAMVTYMLPDGAKDPVQYAIPGSSRNTVNVNAELLSRWGYSGDVSLKVESDAAIIAERPMYFDYMNKWKGGHVAVGARAPSAEWYFAEGYTGLGFEMWVCVLNPGDAAAKLTFRFQTQEEVEEIVVGGLNVPARSRGSFKANDLLGGRSYHTSLKLESTVPVVAERPMYFSYQGMNSWNWQGDHCVMGATELSDRYFFAEGTTRFNFEQWLTLQNPHDETVRVDALYQLGVGQGDPIEESYHVPPRSRATIFVPLVVKDVDVSVLLTSEREFLAERPMYFDYSYMGLNARGGHCVIGALAAASTSGCACRTRKTRAPWWRYATFRRRPGPSMSRRSRCLGTPAAQSW